MGKNCGSWLHHRFVPWKSPGFNYANVVPDPAHQNAFTTFTYPCPPMASANGCLPASAAPDIPCVMPTQANEDNWLYRLSHHNEAVPHILNLGLNEKVSNSLQNCQHVTSNAVPGSFHKRYLVFDQSSDGINFRISSVVGFGHQDLNVRNSIPIGNYGPHQDMSLTKGCLTKHPCPVIHDGLKENQGISEGSEMHEDTEELDALLYSDGDSDFEDEETSTGHSPGEITWHEKQEIVYRAEKACGSVGATKRKRLPDQDHDTSLMDTACSSESSCFEGRPQGVTHSSSTNKRSKREIILETVSILESIIPGGKGKDAVFVLDEAIHYLRSLKLKAKSLGLDLEE